MRNFKYCMIFLCMVTAHNSNSMNNGIPSHAADLDELMESASSGTDESLLPEKAHEETIMETVKRHIQTLHQKARDFLKDPYLLSSAEKEAVTLLSKRAHDIATSSINTVNPADFVKTLFEGPSDIDTHIQNATPQERIAIANYILKLYVDKTLEVFAQRVPKEQAQYMTSFQINAREQANIAQWQTARNHLEEIFPAIIKHCKLPEHGYRTIKTAKPPFYNFVQETMPAKDVKTTFSATSTTTGSKPAAGTPAKASPGSPIDPDDL